MRPSQALISTLQFLLVTSALLAGAFFLGLSISPAMRLVVEAFVAVHPLLFPLLAVGFLGMGVICVSALCAAQQGRSYRLKMDAAVEMALVRAAIHTYWKSLFPADSLVTDVTFLPKKRVEITAEMPPTMELDEQLSTLTRVETELSALLARTLGYDQSFFVTVQLRGRRH